MIDSSNIPPVQEAELLSRYVLQRRHFRADKTPRPELFIPHPHQELSVTRHIGATDNELWQIGKNVAQQREKDFYGRIDIQVKDCQIKSLKVKENPVEGNPNHADITGWPSSKQEQKALALEIAAAKSTSKLKVPTN